MGACRVCTYVDSRRISRATNPGFWYMHCHMEMHNELGMALLLQVGDVKDMPKPQTVIMQCGDISALPNPHLPNVRFPMICPPPARLFPNFLQLSLYNHKWFFQSNEPRLLVHALSHGNAQRTRYGPLASSG